MLAEIVSIWGQYQTESMIVQHLIKKTETETGIIPIKWETDNGDNPQ